MKLMFMRHTPTPKDACNCSQMVSLKDTQLGSFIVYLFERSFEPEFQILSNKVINYGAVCYYLFTWHRKGAFTQTWIVQD